MQTQGEPRASAESPGLTGEIGALLLRAADCLHAAVAPHLAEAGLNGSRFGVLEAIRGHGMAGCSQAELATELLQSESNLSTLLERMRLDGLIVRERSADDRRKSVIRLTPCGEATLVAAAHRREKILSQLLDQLEDPHKSSLTSAVPALLGALGQRVRERRFDHASVSPVPHLGIHGPANGGNTTHVPERTDAALTSFGPDNHN